MPLKFHHAFVFSSPGAPEADALVDAGFLEGASNVHAGQGTRNRRFFFENGMLEFLWVSDEEEVQSPAVARTGLRERSRWLQSGACPFGVAFEGEPPFPTWDYRPPYLPEGIAIRVAAFSTDPAMPFVFVMPGIGKAQQEKVNPRTIESLVVESVQAPPPFESERVSFASGSAQLLELRLKGATKKLDLRPGVPMVVEY